jgi:hypothetical protein
MDPTGTRTCFGLPQTTPTSRSCAGTRSTTRSRPRRSSACTSRPSSRAAYSASSRPTSTTTGRWTFFSSPGTLFPQTCAARAPPLLLRAARAPAPPSPAPRRPTRQVALRVYLGDTHGLPRPALYLPDAEDAPPLLADVNGDLRPDLVGQARNASVGGAEGDTVDGDAAAPLVRTFWVNSLPAEPPACFNGERCGPRPALSLSPSGAPRPRARSSSS